MNGGGIPGGGDQAEKVSGIYFTTFPHTNKTTNSTRTKQQTLGQDEQEKQKKIFIPGIPGFRDERA